MRVIRLFVILAFWATLLPAQRHLLLVDPETKEGYNLQQIRQERDAVEKLRMMNEFVAEFPRSKSISWVLDQLQPVYLEGRDYSRAIELGEKMLAADPDDLDAAHAMLLAAEGLKDPDRVVRYAAAAGALAVKLSKQPGYINTDFARQVAAYAESAIGTARLAERDGKKREEYAHALEQVNPESGWLRSGGAEYFELVRDGASREKLAVAAEKVIASEPDNVDMLLVVADYHMHKGDGREKILEYASRALEILRTKPAAWEAKKDRYTGAANYMVGVIASLQGHFAQADRSLRLSLPTLRGYGEQALGAALYHLGYVNYQLAEAGERQRVFDALKFNEQCADVESTYRDQAKKNVESIRIHYDLK